MSAQVTITNINGCPPYTVQVCTFFNTNCYTAGTFSTVPATITLIPYFNGIPAVKVCISDSCGCQTCQTLPCTTGPAYCNEWEGETTINPAVLHYVGCDGLNHTVSLSFPDITTVCVLDGTTPYFVPTTGTALSPNGTPCGASTPTPVPTATQTPTPGPTSTPVSTPTPTSVSCTEWEGETTTTPSVLHYVGCDGINHTVSLSFPDITTVCVLDGTTPYFVPTTGTALSPNGTPCFAPTATPSPTSTPTPTPVTTLRQILKVNNISSVLGNLSNENARLAYAQNNGFTGIQLYGLYGVFGDPTKESQLASFINRAYTTYGLTTVGCIMGRGNSGFINALAYNASVPAISKFNDFNKENEFWNYFRVDFVISTVVIGFTYSITLNGTTYSYTSVPGDTKDTIAAALALACAPSGLAITIRTTNVTDDTVSIKNTTNIYASFTYSNSLNISDDNINETFTDWIASLVWLKANIGSNGTISAYVANPSNNWGVTEAEQICTNVDYYEGTNYTTTPNESQNSYRNNQLVYIAQGALNIGKVQKHYPIFSSESLAIIPNCGEATFMGAYLQSNGIATANSTWLSQYNADSIPNKTSLEWVGYNYFSYNCLSQYVP